MSAGVRIIEADARGCARCLELLKRLAALPLSRQLLTAQRAARDHLAEHSQEAIP